MHYACIVRVLEPVTDLAQVPPRGERLHRPPVKDVAKRSAADQWHGQERVAIEHLEVVDGQDVRMIELGERLGFGLEPLDEPVVLEQL